MNKKANTGTLIVLAVGFGLLLALNFVDFSGLTGITGSLVLGDNTASNCSTYVNESSTLAGNITGCAGTGLIINASNIVLDCQGYTISGNDDMFSVGISAGFLTNVTVQNCNVKLFETNYFFHDLNDSAFYNNSEDDSGTFTLSSFINSIISNNALHGVSINVGLNLSIVNNLVGSYGIAISTINHSQVGNNTVFNVSTNDWGIRSLDNYNVSFVNNTVFGCNIGLSVENSNYSFYSGNILYNNSRPIEIFNSIVGYSYFEMINTSILPPSGMWENYTVLIINDSALSSERYFINWSEEPLSLPSNHTSFANKFIEIKNMSSTSVSIDRISWLWNESELSGYNEFQFELWTYNGTDWTMLNDTPDTTNNIIGFSNLVPASTYGILQDNSAGASNITFPNSLEFFTNYNETSDNGEIINVTWTDAGAGAWYNLSYSSNGGSTWNYLNYTNLTYYEWQLNESFVEGTNYTLNLTLSDGSYSDVSDSQFWIGNCNVTETSFNTWSIGSVTVCKNRLVNITPDSSTQTKYVISESGDNLAFVNVSWPTPSTVQNLYLESNSNNYIINTNITGTPNTGNALYIYNDQAGSNITINNLSQNVVITNLFNNTYGLRVNITNSKFVNIILLLRGENSNAFVNNSNLEEIFISDSSNNTIANSNVSYLMQIEHNSSTLLYNAQIQGQGLQINSNLAGQNVSVHDVQNNTVFSNVIVEGTSGFFCNVSGSKIVHTFFTASVLSKNRVNNSALRYVTLLNSSANIVENTSIYDIADLSEMSNSSFINTTINALQLHSDLSNHNVSVANVLRNQFFSGVIAAGTSGFGVELSDTSINNSRFYAEAANSVNVVNNSQLETLELFATSKNYFYNLTQRGVFGSKAYGNSKNYFFNSSINSSQFQLYDYAEMNFTDSTIKALDPIGFSGIGRIVVLGTVNITNKSVNSWQINTNAIRYFPIQVLNSSGGNHSGANVSVINSTGGLVASAITDSGGWVDLPVNFTNATFGPGNFSVVVRGSVGYGNISFLENTPIIIQTGDINQSNLTYPNGGEFFTNYDESGQDTGEIINVTWTASDVGSWYYLDYSTNGSNSPWNNIVYTDNTSYLWNISKSLGINESVNYSLRVTASDGFSNATSYVSGNFWIGNCNVSPTSVSDTEYSWNDYDVIVCKNRTVKIDTDNSTKAIRLYNSTAFINVILFNVTKIEYNGPGIVIKNSNISTYIYGRNISASDSYVQYFFYTMSGGTYDGINDSKTQDRVFSEGYFNVSNMSVFDDVSQTIKNNFYVYLSLEGIKANITNSWSPSIGIYETNETNIFIENTSSIRFWLYAWNNETLWVENAKNGVNYGNLAHSNKGFNLTVDNYTVSFFFNLQLYNRENISTTMNLTSFISNVSIAQIITGSNSNNTFYNASFTSCKFGESYNFFNNSIIPCIGGYLTENAILNFSTTNWTIPVNYSISLNANVSIFGNLNVSGKGNTLLWAVPANVTRYFPVYVNDSFGNPEAGANVSVYNSTGSLVGNATVDGSGWAYPSVTFTNFTYNDSYSIVVRGSIGSGNLSFFSDTPIIIQTDDPSQSNLTYPLGGEFFTNYNESGQDTGEIINVTWTDSGFGVSYYLDYSTNGSNPPWNNIVYTDNTSYLWNISKSIGINESINYSLRITSSAGTSNGTSDTSGQFWIGNCNVTQDIAGNWDTNKVTVCKNRSINFVDFGGDNQIIFRNKAALINVLVPAENITAILSAVPVLFIKNSTINSEVRGRNFFITDSYVTIVRYQISMNGTYNGFNTSNTNLSLNFIDGFLNFTNKTGTLGVLIDTANLYVNITHSSISKLSSYSQGGNLSLTNTTVSTYYLYDYANFSCNGLAENKNLFGVLVWDLDNYTVAFDNFNITNTLSLILSSPNSSSYVTNSQIGSLRADGTNSTYYFNNLTNAVYSFSSSSSIFLNNSNIGFGVSTLAQNSVLNISNSNWTMPSNVGLNANVSIYGNFTVNSKGRFINWSVPANVTRFFPVYVNDSFGNPEAGANVSVYNSTGSLVWNGTADIDGWAYPSVTFTNFTYNDSYSIVVRGSVGFGNLSFFSDTPIIIQSGDEVNLTSVFDGQFFTNYNESGQDTGEIINITWQDIGADRYYVQASNGSSWASINSTNTSTFFAWNISKSLGITESTNYSVRVIAEKAGINVSNSTSGQFWIGNCNVTQNLTTGDWNTSSVDIIVCKNRNITLSDVIDQFEEIFLRNKAALVNVSTNAELVYLKAVDYYVINSNFSGTLQPEFSGKIVNTSAAVMRFYTSGNMQINDLKINVPFYDMLNLSGSLINFTNFTSPNIAVLVYYVSNATITNSNLSLVISEPSSQINVTNTSVVNLRYYPPTNLESWIIDANPGIKLNGTVINSSAGLSVYFNDSILFLLDIFLRNTNATTQVENSTIFNLNGGSINNTLYFFNSNFTTHASMIDVNTSYTFINSTFIPSQTGSFGYNISLNFTNSTVMMLKVLNNSYINMYGTFNVTNKGSLINWSVPANVTRFFPVYVRNSTGSPVSGALVNVSNATNLLWSGYTDANGVAEPNVTFTNATYNLTYNVTASWNPTIAGNMGFFSDTPIILQSGCVDNDGDGFGTNTGRECPHPEFDCNDTNYSILPPYDGINVNRSMQFCPGTYYLIPSTDNRTMLITSSNLNLDCNGAVLIGNGFSVIDDGIFIDFKINISIENCNLSNFTDAFNFGRSSNISLKDSSIMFGSDYGVFIDEVYNFSLYNLSISKTGANGVYLIDSDSNLSLIYIDGSLNGIVTNRGNVSVSNVEIYNSVQFGLADGDSENVSIANSHFYNNTISDIYLNSASYSGSMSFSNISLDNPSGNFVNYTVIDFNDAVSVGDSYRIKWSGNPGSLPLAKQSFAGKFLNITNLSGSVSIDSISFRWNDSELTGYNKSRFGLWRYNGTTWTLLNGSPDTLNNVLSLSNLNPASTYGILEDACNDSDGDGFNLSQAGCGDVFDCNDTNASVLPPYDNLSVNRSIKLCPGTYYLNDTAQDGVLIFSSASNTTLDCNGAILIGTGTGIAVDFSGSDHTAVKCNLFNYSTGFKLLDSRGGFLVNNFIDSASTGFLLQASNNTVLINNTVYSSTQNGVFLDVGNHNISIVNNSFICAGSGSAIQVFDDAERLPQNNLVRNNAISNCFIGVYVYGSNYTSLFDNHMYNNTLALQFASYFGSTEFVNVSNLTIDNPLGDFVNYTVLYIEDTIDPNAAYNIKWSNLPAALPSAKRSFNGKFVNITNLSGVSIDLISFSWDESEVSGYNESRLQLWVYNGSWYLLNDTPDTLNNVLSLSNLNPASTYGILEDNSTVNLSVNITFPQDNVEYNVSSNFTLSSNISNSGNSNATNCNATLIITDESIVNITSTESKIHILGNVAPGSVNETWNLTALSAGNVNITVNVSCDSNNFANDSVYNITVLSYVNQAPVVVLVEPLNQTQINNTDNIDLNFTVTDDVNTTLTCELYVNDAFNQTKSSVQNGTITNFNINVTFGSYNWTINCTDGSLSNVSETWYFSVNDTLPPAISNIVNTTTNGSATVNWTTNESADSNLNYGVSLGLGSGTGNALFVINHSILIIGLDNNTLYYYNITSCDPYDNCATVGPYNFTTLQNNVTNVSDLPPTITSLGCAPNPAYARDYIVCRANVFDDNEIGNVTANVTKPDSARRTQNPICTGTNTSKTCSFTFSDTDRIGTYNVLWAGNDTAGNSDTASSSFVIRAAVTPGDGGGGQVGLPNTLGSFEKKAGNITPPKEVIVSKPVVPPVPVPPQVSPVVEKPGKVEFTFPYWIVLVLIAVIILPILFFLVRHEKKKKPKFAGLEKGVAEYITKSREASVSDLEIRTKLINAEWDEKLVDSVFNKLK